MVKIKVEIDDWDTGLSTELTLPCDVKKFVDTTHELQIVDWEGDFFIGQFDDVLKFNNFLDDLNSECPNMSLELLSIILASSSCATLSDTEFVRKVHTSDFMFEEVSGVTGSNNEEKCACYLATEMMIPFAKNITGIHLEKMSEMKNKVLWNRVWDYYNTMGFKIIAALGKLYVFHWGDAEE